jgi:hypothetical protein
VVIVKQFGPRPVVWGVLAWALVVAVCLFVAWTSPHAGISNGDAHTAYWIAGSLTAALGLWLGWRHRMGTAFVAPLLAWFVVVPFAFASEFLKSGFFMGLVRGLGLAIFGGFVASFVEGVFLVAFAALGRIAAAALGHREPASTVIFPPRTG